MPKAVSMPGWSLSLLALGGSKSPGRRPVCDTHHHLTVAEVPSSFQADGDVSEALPHGGELWALTPVGTV